MDNRFSRNVTVRQNLSPRLLDLCYFAEYLQEQGLATLKCNDQSLAEAADAFWDRQHGED